MVRVVITSILILSLIAEVAIAAYMTAYDVGTFMPGVPDNSAIIRIGIPRPIKLLAGLPNSVCVAKAAATSSTTVVLNKVHSGSSTSIGSLVWSAAGTVCSKTFSSDVSFVVGDVIEEAFPATADVTLADIAITLAGVRP